MKRFLTLILAVLFLALSAGCFGTGNTNGNNNTITPPPSIEDDLPPEGPTKPEKPVNPDYSEFSQAMQNVLTDNHYLGLIAEAEKHSSLGAYSKNNNTYMAIPYQFLTDEGFDVLNISKNNLRARSELFTIGNDLYITLYAEKAASTNYFANYVLKYELTNQELSDLNRLYSSANPTDNSTYVQAPFFIQELSKLKTPEVISEAYITPQAYERVNADIKNDPAFENGVMNATFMGYKQEQTYGFHNYTFLVCENSSNAKAVKNTGKMGIITYTTIGDVRQDINGNKVYYNDQSDITSGMLEENRTAFQNSIKRVTFYHSNNCALRDYIPELNAELERYN